MSLRARRHPGRRAGLRARRTRGRPPDPRDVIELRWVKSYPRESRSDVETGLLWGLSLLGVNMPKKARAIRWQGERITLDLGRAQLVDGTAPAWRQLIAAMKASGEYQAAWRTRRRTLHCAHPRKYLITTTRSPAPAPSYEEARGRYRFESKPAAIFSSGVALGNRRIDVSIADRVDADRVRRLRGRVARSPTARSYRTRWSCWT